MDRTLSLLVPLSFPVRFEYQPRIVDSIQHESCILRTSSELVGDKLVIEDVQQLRCRRQDRVVHAAESVEGWEACIYKVEGRLGVLTIM